jgi:BirA family biotin operon repressor/biotin-[acetyl-CoA-carboxylase] ligase
LGSTNSALLANTMAVEGDWLVALRQDEGRGRHGRAWQSLAGNFLGSTLIQLRRSDPPAPSLALVAGLALIEAVEEIAPAAPLQLKWPNDLMMGRAKLAGILLERAGDRVVAGVGVNLAAAPPLDDRRTAALDGATTVQVFAPLLAAKFERLLVAWRLAEPSALTSAWLARAHPVGTPLEIHASPGQRLAGRFEGLASDGAMLLRREDGSIETVRAGDVALA